MVGVKSSKRGIVPEHHQGNEGIGGKFGVYLNINPGSQVLSGGKATRINKKITSMTR
jgi:hypothetical protein